jgi:Na+/H+ antiporter NhaD/arsenite permease-like protein
MLRISLAQKLIAEKRKRSTFNTYAGPVANMIVVESAREHLEISFWDYARVGIPITFLTTAAGILVLLLLH